MSRSSSWRRHADSLATERERLYPGSVPLPDDVIACPLHGGPLGSLSHMCATCFQAAWDWTAERALGEPTIGDA